MPETGLLGAALTSVTSDSSTRFFLAAFLFSSSPSVTAALPRFEERVDFVDLACNSLNFSLLVVCTILILLFNSTLLQLHNECSLSLFIVF